MNQMHSQEFRRTVPLPGGLSSRALRRLATGMSGVLLMGFSLDLARPVDAAEAGEPAGFRFAAVNPGALGLWEGERPVLVYQHGTRLAPGVPADRARSSYVHPLYGLDSEVLTDDFPKDHYHHRGLFWAWPHIVIDGTEGSTWDLRRIEQRWIRWLRQETLPEKAVLEIENGWFVGDRQVLRERVLLTIQPATATSRAIDVELELRPIQEPVLLRGAEGKSYGGLTLRFAPRTHTVITTPLGTGDKDLAVTRLKWADLSARFSGTDAASGAAIFIGPDHPDYPPTWLTRHYGVLCVGWPGVKSLTLPKEESVRLRYRVWVHKGVPEQAVLQRAYDEYAGARR